MSSMIRIKTSTKATTAHHSVDHDSSFEEQQVNDRREMLDRKVRLRAEEGLEQFIEDVFTEASNWAQRYANVALMSGLAAGALTPVLELGDVGTEWLSDNQYQTLAQWAEDVSHEHTIYEIDTVALAENLDAYIHGQTEETQEGILLRDAHPKAGEEITRLLRTLDLSGALQKALTKQDSKKRILLSSFSEELSRLFQRPLANTYVVNSTIQEIATQGFLLLADDVERGRGMSTDMKELHAKIAQLVERPSLMIIDKLETGGGMVNFGSIHTSGGAVIGRDGQVGFNCP